jgi:Na+/H+ antiporter NhaD/arsenite permease-like protein
MVIIWNAGLITMKDALGGFSNSGLLAVGVLFVVVQGVEKSQLAPTAARYVCGTNTGIRSGLARMSLFIFILSAFLNNT